jgi:MFS transporter, Spinster family, sphingosine-1-phosphate transporter
VRAAALAVNIFIFHLLGDVPSPALIGYMSDKYSLQLAFVGPVIAIALSSAILFYGMRFAPPVRISEEPAASQLPPGASS